ncbi:MAG: hypothetical protein H0X51_04505 [Parachlamydiaceae bacterium]|nr:hypothetical protein [Parachlamydiaceae bacterium]
MPTMGSIGVISEFLAGSALLTQVGRLHSAFTDTMKRITPIAGYCLRYGAIAAGVAAIASFIFSMYAHALIFTALCVVDCIGAYYAPTMTTEQSLLEAKAQAKQLAQAEANLGLLRDQVNAVNQQQHEEREHTTAKIEQLQPLITEAQFQTGRLIEEGDRLETTLARLGPVAEQWTSTLQTGTEKGAQHARVFQAASQTLGSQLVAVAQQHQQLHQRVDQVLQHQVPISQLLTENRKLCAQIEAAKGGMERLNGNLERILARIRPI